MSDFPKALSILLTEEGGWYPGDQPWDPNPTMHGVTQERYDIHRTQGQQSPRSVQRISEEEVHQIYLDDYWLPSHADALTWPLSLLHFDFAVNAGPEEAIRVLQRVMDVADDGVWGSQTAAAGALASRSVPIIARDLLLERLFAYDAMVQRDPSKVVPLYTEWIPRVKGLYQRHVIGGVR